MAQFNITANSFGSKSTNFVDKRPIAHPINQKIKYRYIKFDCKTNKSHNEKLREKFPEKNNQKIET